MSTPASKIDEDWKLEFENGTTFIGVGSPPKVWHLVESSEAKENTKQDPGDPMAHEEARDDENTRKPYRQMELNVSPISSPSRQDS